MIRLTGNRSAATRSPWRRRISNQLAAFAAIMLFASTQVNAPQQTGLASLSGLAETVTQQAQLGNSAGPESAEGTSVSTDATKKKRFKLSIFLLRR